MTSVNEAYEILYKRSENVHFLNEKVEGYSFEDGVSYPKILATYNKTGFQATNFGRAVDEINKMLMCRDVELPATYTQINSVDQDEFIRVKSNCTIFLGYTSNIVSSGLRDTVRFLVKNKLIDCIVTTAGGVEEDFIKCLAPTYVGSFNLPGKTLREQGINRTGNLLVPNDNYVEFKEWIMPVLDEMLREQKENGVLWTPSQMITRMGEVIGNEESICYWAAKNKIPIYCPAITDGSIGDMLFFHGFENPGLIVDIAADVRRINLMALSAVNTGAVIVGGGVIKHHINNANLMRNGSDFAVYLNTAAEFDGSDAGARPDEAVSWGKIKAEATPIKIHAEASLILPLLVAETFAKHHFKKFK